MDILIALIVICAVIAIAWWAITQLSLPPPVRMVAIVVMAILAILLLLRLMPGVL